jgi:hypothetical protein
VNDLLGRTDRSGRFGDDFDANWVPDPDPEAFAWQGLEGRDAYEEAFERAALDQLRLERAWRLTDPRRRREPRGG